MKMYETLYRHKTLSLEPRDVHVLREHNDAEQALSRCMTSALLWRWINHRRGWSSWF